jgi:DNA invertase Pin-like site-specific DNA recombinase
LKAFGYIRVSGKGQLEGTGLDRQSHAIAMYCKNNNIELVEYFSEEGVSGTLEIRPALASLMLSLEENGHGVKTVIVERLDRLARDLMVQEAIIADFQKKGFSLISATEGSDLLSSDPTRKLVRQVLGAIAEYDKTMTVAKLRAARDRIRLRSGHCEGRPPLPSQLVDRIKELQKSDLTSSAIASTLNSEGTRNQNGSLFTASNIRKILHRKK